MHPTIFALKRAYQATRKAMDEGLGAYGLTASQLDILIYLKRVGVAQQRDLQSALGVTSATLTRILDGMTQRGLVMRVPSQDDARVNLVRPSDKAVLLVEELHQKEEAGFVNRFLLGLSSDDVERLNRYLNQVAANMGDHSQSIF